MNTRRYPRTLQEAFGPYTSHDIQEPKRPMDWQDKAVMCACAVATVVLAIVLIAERL